MTFDELEIGKEYSTGVRFVVRVIAKVPDAVALQMIGAKSPFFHRDINSDFSGWRPYVPPPAPLVRFAFARVLPGGLLCVGTFADERDATNDIYRVGPVVPVELPVDPDMFAKVSK